MSARGLAAFLDRMGLSGRESETYLFCLKAGPVAVSQLAKRLGLTRTNAYDVVRKLEEKGFVHQVGAAYGRRIKANPPGELKALIRERVEATRSLEKDLEELLPAFAALDAGPSPFSRVSYFDGAENIKKMLWRSVNAGSKEVLVAGSEYDIHKSIGTPFLREYHAYRRKFGTRLLALRPGPKRLPGAEFNDDATYLREIRVKPEGTIRLWSNLMIWDDQVAFYALKDRQLFGILVENEMLAGMLRSWFMFIWEASEAA